MEVRGVHGSDFRIKVNVWNASGGRDAGLTLFHKREVEPVGATNESKKGNPIKRRLIKNPRATKKKKR